MRSDGPAGTQEADLDAAGRPLTQRLDGAVVAATTYDAAGQLASVTYPAGAGNGGNATALQSVGYDGAGRTAGLTWALGGGAGASDAVSYSQSGRVVDQSIDGVDARPGAATFSYDGAGRLSAALVPERALTYGFDPGAGCGVLTKAAKNTNRSTVADNAGPTTTYCYGGADRLSSTSDARARRPTILKTRRGRQNLPGGLHALSLTTVQCRPIPLDAQRQGF
ncbi:MAG: hypothetical protein M3349_08820 [Actinomycetota bacterium]|nr:hypothetical protein [Actinomycetota bacterium]